MKIIKNTNNKYSIDEKGNIYCLYKKRNNVTIAKQNKIITPYLNNSGLVIVSLILDNKTLKPSIIHLMCEYFNIVEPDKYHRYVPYNVDGNVFNCSLNNICFKRVFLKEYKYYPYYFGNTKICGNCGKEKSINNFRLIEKTYRNICNRCRKIQEYKLTKKRSNSVYNEYHKNYDKQYRQKLNSSYLACSLRISVKELTQELETIAIKKITLHRDVKNIKNNKSNS